MQKERSLTQSKKKKKKAKETRKKILIVVMFMTFALQTGNLWSKENPVCAPLHKPLIS